MIKENMRNLFQKIIQYFYEHERVYDFHIFKHTLMNIIGCECILLFFFQSSEHNKIYLYFLHKNIWVHDDAQMECYIKNITGIIILYNKYYRRYNKVLCELIQIIRILINNIDCKCILLFFSQFLENNRMYLQPILFISSRMIFITLYKNLLERQ